jgi:colanic acid biosynthesis glycosyl transferase WcaI
LKICLISEYWEPDVNGDVTRLKKVIEDLKKSGHQVTLITTAPHYPAGETKGYKFRLFNWSRENGMSVLRIKMPPLPHSSFATRFTLYFWFAALAIIPTIVLGRSKMVWAFSQRVFSTYTAMFAKLFWRARLVSDVTDVWPEALINTGYARIDSVIYRAARFAAKAAYRTSDEITTLTPQMAGMFREAYGVQKEKIRIIPNVGKESKPKASVNSEQQTRKFQILYYGNLGTNYDFAPVLKVAEKLKGEPVKFVIKASGGEWIQKIQWMKKEANLDNVELITRVLSEDELHDMVGEANALILSMGNHPFPDASFPIKFVEYLHAARPIIYIGRGYPRELVEKYKLGIASDWNDIDGVVKFIGLLRRDPVLCAEMGMKAKVIADEMFSETTFENSLGELLRVPI